MSLNENLRKAKRRKNDEFYTQLSDIENELRHYTGHFRGQGRVLQLRRSPPSPTSSTTSRTTSNAWA